MAKVYLFKDRGGRQMKKVTVFDVAKYFLSRVEFEAGSLMTHLKLQKLCYYAQAWHLVFENVPLFDEHFEAWAHGPVSPSLFQEYKGYSYHPIPAPEDFDDHMFNSPQKETLEAVWDTYGQFEAKYLEDLTHQENPWITARGNCQPGEICTNTISLELMKEYYSKLNQDG